jgi:hypothetical protein
VLFAGLALYSAAHAQGLPLWEIGAVAFGVSQQAYPGADQQVNRALALPFVIYRGRYLRADRDSAGLRALKTPRVELDIGFAGAFAARSDEIDARRGMPDLGTLVEAGPRLKWNLAQGAADERLSLELPLRGVFDLDDRAAHRGMSFEPELAYARRAQGRWSASTSVSAIVADQRMARTLYAVAPAYARADRPAYQARSGGVAAGSFVHAPDHVGLAAVRLRAHRLGGRRGEPRQPARAPQRRRHARRGPELHLASLRAKRRGLISGARSAVVSRGRCAARASCPTSRPPALSSSWWSSFRSNPCRPWTPTSSGC